MTDLKEKGVVGASPEKGESAGSQSGSQAKTQERKLTPSFLQEFLSNLKVNALMKKAKPGSEKMASLVAIEEGLASEKAEEKQGALDKLDELLKVRAEAEVKADGMLVGQLVADVPVKPEILEKVQQVAATIDSHMAELEAGKVDQEHLKTLEAEINLLAAGLELEGGAELAEGMSSKLQYMQTLAESRQKMKVEDPKYTTLDFYKDEFEAGEAGKVIKLRDVPSGEEASELQARLEKYKAHVREELIGGSKEKLEKLSPDELLQRLEEASYWDEHFGDLFGHGKGEAHRGSKARNELRGLLIMVEAQYTAALEKKLGEKLGATGDRGVAVRLALQEELKKKKPYGHAKYDFERNKQAGKTAYQMLEGEVAQRAGKIEQKMEKKGKYTVRNADTSYGGSVERHLDDEVIYNSIEEVEEDWKKVKSNQARMDTLLNKLGIESMEDLVLLKSKLQEPGGYEQLIEEARARGMNEAELSDFQKVLRDMGRKDSVLNEAGFTGVQAELVTLSKEAKRTGNYSKYMIKLQAYIDRVGLREASSDFQFAIVMRQAKDEISKKNSDAGGKFDLWQESQFLPSITSLDEKTFYSISPKVMNQIRAKMELEGPMANWLAMQVDGKGGKKAMSVASFYQMLQRRDVAKRVIAAPINSADGTIMQLWAEHVWGEGAKLVMSKEDSNVLSHIELADGTPIYDIDVDYFVMDNNPRPDANSKEKMKIADFMEQSMWMAHYAQKMWWYSGEWEAFARDFPGEMLPQANKRLLSIGAAFRDYGLEYGKFDVGYSELAKAGVLLQDFRTYKAGDVIVANMRHMLYDKGLASAKEGEEYGKAIFDALAVRARISEDYNPISSLRSVDEIQLMGQLGAYSSPEAKWNWYKKQQEKMGRKGVPEYSYIAGLRSKNFEELRGNDEGWFIQAEQIDLLFDELSEQRAKLGKLNWNSGVLHELMDRQQFVETGSHREKGGESLDEFLKNFQYTSVLSYSELRKGTDPLDYQKYSEAKIEAASMMTEVLNGVPSMEKLAELFTKMRSYMPPDQVVAWFKAFREKQVQLRTFQTMKYDIAMTDKEEWEMRKKRGEDVGEHPPSIVIGYNPAMFKIKDERGDSWNVTGADGFRVVRMKKEWGNHMWKTRKIPPLSAAEIELQNQVYVGNRWLMSDTAEEILENSFGLSQFINKFYKDRGWDPNSKGAKLMKKYGTKAWLLLRQHPLFDDPVWAFWNILNELKEYGEEVQKEMVKDIAK